MVFKTSDFRPAIIRMHEKGKSMNKIAEDLGISRHAVQDAVKRFEETGSNFIHALPFFVHSNNSRSEIRSFKYHFYL
jgi:predicted DNA-binding protein YlxM (UPF0122 family)